MLLDFYGSLEHLYLRFTCVVDDPGPLQMFACEQKESFKVPRNLFTWDLHVMILNLYRCLLVSRNNLLWFFKTFCKQVHWVFAKPIVSKFGGRNNLLALPVLIASRYEFYMSILLSKGLGITGTKSKCIIKILKNHMSALESSYKFYMKFICSLFAVSKLHVFICSFDQTTCSFGNCI